MALRIVVAFIPAIGGIVVVFCEVAVGGGGDTATKNSEAGSNIDITRTAESIIRGIITIIMIEFLISISDCDRLN